MKTITIRELTKRALAILAANNATPKCILVQVNHFTHSNGSESFQFSINAGEVFTGENPDHCLQQLKASFAPKFDGDIKI